MKLAEEGLTREQIAKEINSLYTIVCKVIRKEDIKAPQEIPLL